MLVSKMIQSGASDYLPKNQLDQTNLLRATYHAMEKTRLIMEAKSAQKKLAEMSTTDSLTGLYNQRYFNEAMEREFLRAQRYESVFSLCLIDLDQLQKVNDTLGHPAGDMVLKDTGRLLTSNFRKSDILFRYGGEKFCVIMLHTDREDALLTCETFRKAVSNHPFEHEVVVMQGNIALVQEDGETPITVGDAVLVTPDEKHRFRNASDTEPAKMLCIVPVEYQK